MNTRRALTCLGSVLLLAGAILPATPAAAADPPAPVIAAEAETITATGVTLHWANAANVYSDDGITIRRHDGQWSADGSVQRARITNEFADQWSDTGLTPGATYSYGIYATYEGPALAEPVIVTVTIPTSPSISGTVTGKANGGALEDVTVQAIDALGHSAGTATTGADGSYGVYGLKSGSKYRICFDPTTRNTKRSSENGFTGSCRGGATADVATAVTAPATGVDAALADGGAITGLVTGALNTSGTVGPLAGVSVVLAKTNGEPLAYVLTDKDGRYRHNGLAAGTYSVCFDSDDFDQSHSPAHLVQCWKQLSATDAPTPVTVADRATVTGIDAKLVSGTDPVGGEVAGAVSTRTLPSVPCANVVFVGARGAGESGPGGLRRLANDPNEGVGGPLHTVYATMKQQLEAGGLTVTPPVSVYSAARDWVPDLSRTFPTEPAKDLYAALTARQRQCPYESLVLAGFAGGTDTIFGNGGGPSRNGLLDPLRLQATVLLADARQLGGRKTAQFGTATSVAQGVRTLFSPPGDTVGLNQSQTYGVYSACNAYDIFCDTHVPDTAQCTSGECRTFGTTAGPIFARGIATNLRSYDGTPLTKAAATAAAKRVMSFPHITTETLPDAQVGVPYSFALKTADNRPGTWTIIGGLPAGLKQNGNVISGTPTSTYWRRLSVGFRDQSGQSTKVMPYLTVKPAGGSVGTPVDDNPPNVRAVAVAAAGTGDYLVYSESTVDGSSYLQWRDTTQRITPVLKLPGHVLGRVVISPAGRAYFTIGALKSTEGGELVSFGKGDLFGTVRYRFTQRAGNGLVVPSGIAFANDSVYVSAAAGGDPAGCGDSITRFSTTGSVLATGTPAKGSGARCGVRIGAGTGNLTSVAVSASGTTESAPVIGYYNPTTLAKVASYSPTTDRLAAVSQGPTGDVVLVTTASNGAKSLRRVTASGGQVSNTPLNTVQNETGSGKFAQLTALTVTSDNEAVVLGDTSAGPKVTFVRPDGQLFRQDVYDYRYIGLVPDGSGGALLTGTSSYACPEQDSPYTCDDTRVARLTETTNATLYQSSFTSSEEAVAVAAGKDSLGLVYTSKDQYGVDPDQTTARTVDAAGLTPAGWYAP